MLGPRAKRLAGSCWHVGVERVRWESSETLTPDKHTLESELHDDGLGYGSFADTIHKVTLDIERPQPSKDEIRKLKEAMSSQRRQGLTGASESWKRNPPEASAGAVRTPERSLPWPST